MAAAGLPPDALNPSRWRNCGWWWNNRFDQLGAELKVCPASLNQLRTELKICPARYQDMLSLYDISAPAKLNLFLHVTGRRADGYHLLQSVFMLIDWCDTLHFERRSDGQVSREDLSAPLPPEDLIVRAARALKAASRSRFGVHIGVHKRIPVQAGMGGGSSDAASTLLVLNRLWKLNYSAERLVQIGLGLGADVPFFLGGRNAWVAGIGQE